MLHTPVSHDKQVGTGHIIISKLSCFLEKEKEIEKKKRNAIFSCVLTCYTKPSLEIGLEAEETFSYQGSVALLAP